MTGAHMCLFQSDSTFEMISITNNTYPDAMFGRYQVADNDLSATLTVTKQFDSEDEEYWPLVGNEQEHYTIVYQNDQYLMDMAYPVSMDPYVEIEYTLVLSIDTQGEMVREQLPDDPNGDAFDPQYQVLAHQWKEFFNTPGEILNKNFKVQGTLMYGLQPIEYSWEVDDCKLHYTLNTVQWYYNIKNPINDPESGALVAFTADVYQQSGNEWIKNNGEFDYLRGIHEFGTLPYVFTNFTYSSTGHYYYASSINLSCSYDSGHSMTNVKIYFTEGNLLKITYTESGQNEEFNFTQQGQTHINFPSTFPATVEESYGEILNREFHFKEAYGTSLQAADITLMNQAYVGHSVLSFFNDRHVEMSSDQYFNGNLHSVESISFTLYGTLTLIAYLVNNGNPYVTGTISWYGYLEDGTYQLIDESNDFRYWLRNGDNPTEARFDLADEQYYQFTRTSIVPTEVPHGDPQGGGGGGGGQQQVVSWPETEVASAIANCIENGANLNDGVPAMNMEGATYAYVDDNDTDEFEIVLTFSSNDALTTYENILRSANFKFNVIYPYDLGVNGAWISPNHELVLHLEYMAGMLLIYVKAYYNYGLPTTFLYYNDGSGWDYEEMTTDPEHSDQYYLPNFHMTVGTEFVICAGEDDWRHYNNINSEWSLNEENFGPGNENSNNILCMVEGYYNIYVKKAAEDENDPTIILNLGAAPALGYPTEDIATYLNGAADPYIEFSDPNATGYDIDDEGTYIYLTISFEDGLDLESIVEGFEESLKTTNGYGLKTHDVLGTMLVSAQREIGFALVWDDDADEITVQMFNFTRDDLDQIFTVDYLFYCDNTWDIFQYDAVFYGFLLGGAYSGEWVELSVYDLDEKIFYVNDIDDSVEQITIVRFVNGEADPDWAKENWYHQTDDIDLTGNNTEIHFTLRDR